MHKQVKQIAGWFSRARVLLFVLIFSMVLLGSVIARFALQNNWLEVEFANQVRTTELNNQVTMLRLYIKNAESGERGYAISGDRIFVEKFDATIDSIRAIYKQVQQLENRNEDDTDAVLFLASDSLVKQKIAFMQRVKKLCDNNDCKSAAALIATNQGEKLSDSIALINQQINANIQQRLKKSQTVFLKIKRNNSNLAFTGIIASMLLIILVFSLLFKALRKTKKISDELYLRKENYRVTLNSLGEGLISTDEKGRITYMNPSAEQLTGWRWQDAKEQLLHQVFDVVNEQTGKPIEHIVSRILKDGKKIDWENNTVLKAKNNAEFIISNNGSAILDVNGHTSGAVLLFNDITEKYKIERQLKDSERQYRDLIQNLPEAVYTCDSSGYIQLYNKAAVKLWGREPVAGKDLWCGSWKIFNTDGTDLPLDSCPMAITLKEGMPVHGKEIMVQRPDESYRHVLPYPSPLFNAEGKLTGAINMLIDVTDKKEREILIQKTEEKYRNLVEQASDAILIYSFDGTIHEFNKACHTMLGYSKEEYAKLKLTDILVDEIIVNQDNYAAILAGDTKTLNRKLMRKDGSLLETEVTVKMLADGKAISFARDITERKRAAEELKKSEEKFRTLVEFSPVGIFLFQPDGHVTYGNPADMRMTGLDEEDTLGLNWIKAIHPEDLPIVMEDWKKAAETGKSYAGTGRYLHKDGTIVYWDVATAPIIIDGTTTGYIGTVTDITERKKAEEALKESEIFTRSILTSIGYHIAVIETSGNIISVNKAWDDFSAQNGETALERTGIGSNYISVCKASAGAGDSLAAKALHGFEQVVKKEIPFFEMEYPCNSADEQRWFLLRVVNFSDDSPKVVMMHMDITEIKKAEEALIVSEKEFRSLAESMPQIVWTTRADGWNIYFNQHWVDYTGLSLEESYGHGWNKPFHPDDQQRAWDAWQNAVQNLAEYVLECRLRKHDGTYHWWLIRGIPQIGDNGEILQWYGTCTDIEKIKQAEQELIRSEEKYRSMVENNLAGIYQTTTGGKILACNNAYAQMLGYSIEILTQQEAGILYFDKTNRHEFLEKLSKTGNIINQEIKLKHSDGSPVFMMESCFLNTDALTGEQIIEGVAIDISKRKHAEETIKKEKELSDSVIKSLPGVFYFYDEHLKLLRWNKQLENVTGYSGAELSAMNPAELFTGEDRVYMQERSRKVFASGSGDAETNFTTKTGKKIPFYFTGIRMQYEDKPALLGIGIDITERKNAELITKKAIERYDILADATSDTIWDWDITNNTMLYNDGISKMFGYNTSEVENVVDWWNDKLHSDDFQNVTHVLEDVFEKKMEKIQLTYRFRCADGSYKHIFDRAFVIFDKDGKPTRMIGAMQDITYQSEEEIRIAKATIDAQEEERSYLSAELHDNINQILAGTLLTLGMAKSKEVNAGQQKEFVETAIGYITDAISETRKLSHNLAPAHFEDNTLIDLFENLLLAINLENLFTVKLDFDELKEIVIPENIQVNLYRILQEQTKNILKYAEASTIEITVKIIDNTVMLSIHDNGKGFDTKAKKTGIGLSNIKKRAESLNGKFILNSAPGKGCEIIVEIPLSL